VEEETTEEIKEEKPEEPKVTEEPNVLETPEVKEQPEILVTLEETTKELAEPSKPETPKVTEETSVLEKPEVQNKQDIHSQSDVPSSKENNKQSKSLPQTGGVSTESTSTIAGMLALILGAMMFRRKKN
ncbi:LPXTG cell wall anchor domain-containing protein, partial [Bacillus cereus]